MPSWRRVNGRYYAVWSYPSRARDSFTREGFLEKQVLEWIPVQGVPAAAAAFLLLSRAADFSDQIWFDRASDSDWGRRDYSLEIPPIEELFLNGEYLREPLATGLREWANRDTAPLEAVYAAIRTRQRPALLGGESGPLSPTALAALLLPLPRECSDALSLAGWSPSETHEEEDGDRWSVIVRRPAPSAPPEIELEDRFKAHSLAEREPTLAVGPRVSVTKLLDFARGQARWLDRPRSREELNALLPMERQELDRSVKRIRAEARMDIGLPDPLADARRRHLEFKADVIEAACYELYNVPFSGHRVQEVLDTWRNATANSFIASDRR
jgi:hypothetical protein